MTVQEIVEKYLRDNGYDGLYRFSYCDCDLSDLMNCDAAYALDCQPGYKIPKENDEEDYIIVPGNPAGKESE